MARKKHLINVHTSTGTTAPTGASLYLGEIAVQHTPNDPALWIKMGTSEASTTYEKIIGETKITELIEGCKILGSGYTYSGLSFVNSSTTIADAYSALTKVLIDDEKVIAEAFNDINDKMNVVSGDVAANTSAISAITTNISNLSGAVVNNETNIAAMSARMLTDEYVTARALNDINDRIIELSGATPEPTGIQAITVNGSATPVSAGVAQITGVQETLVSGTNIKTINNQSLLGSGNITIQGGGGDATWGSITGTLSTQTDLNTALNGKQDTIDSSHKLDYSLIDNTPSIPAAPGTLTTTAATALSTVTNEALSGNVQLHKVSKTGSYTDLNNKPTIPSAPGSLTTTATTALATASTESLTGSVQLHKVSKTGSYSDLNDKPTIPSAPGTLNTDNSTAQSVNSSEALTGTVKLHKVAKTGTYSDLIGTPTIPNAPGTLTTTATTSQAAATNEALSGSVQLHKVSKTGSYNDLNDKPTIPAAQVQSDWNATSGMGVILNKPNIPNAPGTLTTTAATGLNTASNEALSGNVQLHKVSKTGSYNDLTNKPNIPTALSSLTDDSTHRLVTDTEKTTWNGKQDALVSGTNIKTINNQSLLGSGNITIQGGGGDATWGSITGTLTAQTDLNTALNGKQDTIDASHKLDYSLIANTPTIPSAPGTLNTTATTAQSTSASEALSGNIKLHKVAKTGTYSDLIGTPTIPSAPGTLNTTATTAQATNASEALTGAIKLHKVAKTGTYSDLIGTPTIPAAANNGTLTIQKNGTTVQSFSANQSTNVTANIIVNELPTVTSSNNGQLLQVVNGAWALVNPIDIYTGSNTPSSSLGNNGDVYFQI